MAYITVETLRSEGCPEPPYSASMVEQRIALACSTVDQMTGCFFEKKEGYVITMDGHRHDTLFLPVPPVSVDAITSVVVDAETLDAEYYEVLMSEVPDGRFNPKLRHLTSTWPIGKSNIVITGDFGFVEPDESTPPLIINLVTRIAVWNLPKVGDVDAQRASQIVEESLKDYRYKLADPSAIGRGFFSDPKIDNLIAMFKRPAMGVL